MSLIILVSWNNLIVLFIQQMLSAYCILALCRVLGMTPQPSATKPPESERHRQREMMRAVTWGYGNTGFVTHFVLGFFGHFNN